MPLSIKYITNEQIEFLFVYFAYNTCCFSLSHTIKVYYCLLVRIWENVFKNS